MTAEVSTSPKWHKLFKVSLFVLIPLALLGGFFVTWFGIPLIHRATFSFTYTVNRVDFRDGETFQPLGRPDIFYLRLPHTSEPRYQWFLIRRPIQNIAAPIALHTTVGGLHYVHDDQLHGISLTDSKIDDQWQIHWSNSLVQFKNRTLSVQGQFTQKTD